jgi:hypothetical protein
MTRVLGVAVAAWATGRAAPPTLRLPDEVAGLDGIVRTLVAAFDQTIVVEFGSASEQLTLDRYIRGDDVSMAQLQQVWKTTEAGPRLNSQLFSEFFAAVRDVNSKLPGDRHVRVFGGDPGPGARRMTDCSP